MVDLTALLHRTAPGPRDDSVTLSGEDLRTVHELVRAEIERHTPSTEGLALGLGKLPYSILRCDPVVVLDAGGRTVGRAHKGSSADPQTLAKLWAASPSLADACQALDALWTADIPHDPGQPGEPRLFAPEALAVWRKVRAALALARGETHAG